MPDLSLKDRLQPALLDRLSDDERLVTVFRVTPRRDELAALNLSSRDVHRLLTGHGLRPVGAAARIEESEADVDALEYTVAGRSISPAQLRALTLAARADSAAVTLGSCCQVEASSAANDQIEAPERRAMSMRKLRDAVLRDLGWLLNSSNLEEVVDLAPHPDVRRSVLNYGLPSLAGRAVAAIDAAALGRRIAETLAFFEPRLSAVRVTHDRGGPGSGEFDLTFRVEAELWGQPVAQHLALRTSIDVITGAVSVVDEAARG